MTSVHPGDTASTAAPESRSAQTALASHPDLVLRPAAERFHSSHGWLESWHSFSFAGHDDPAWRGFGPLLVINDDRLAAGRGFGMHPHRDMEIITVMVEGVLHHRDSMGHSEALRAGEVQRMSAGSGIVHSEMNEESQSCRLLQIWIAPSQQGLPPATARNPLPSARAGPCWSIPRSAMGPWRSIGQCGSGGPGPRLVSGSRCPARPRPTAGSS